MREVLDVTILGSVIQLLKNIEDELSFDEVTGKGTAAELWANEKNYNAEGTWYNHLWTKFLENQRRAALLLQSFSRTHQTIISKFRHDISVPNNIIWTIAHFVQNEVGLCDMSKITTDLTRADVLSRAFKNLSEDAFGPYNPVLLWTEMNDDEKNNLCTVIIDKIAEYAIRTVKMGFYRLPTHFVRNSELAQLGYFPILDVTGIATFLWCKVPVTRMYNLFCGSMVYTLRPNVQLAHLPLDEEDVFVFGERVLRYENGLLKTKIHNDDEEEY